MTTFTVEWTIEIDAATPEEAARAAYQRILAKAHGVTLDVYSDDPDEGDGYHHHKIDFMPDGSRAPAVGLRAVQAELDRVMDEISEQELSERLDNLLAPQFSAEASL